MLDPPLSNTIEIRPYRDADHEAVVALWSEVFSDDPLWNAPTEIIRRKCTVQRELFFVAMDGHRLVGTALAGFDGVRGWLHHVAVHPASRRQGIATQLIQIAEHALAAMGCPKINLQVRPTNKEVIAFYRAAGYSIEDRMSMGKPL